MKIALIGYGKMGKAVENLSIARGHDIVLRIARENATEFTKSNLQKADVAIEFSLPDTAYKNISFCLEHHVPVVSGTTGWLEQLPVIEKLCATNEGAFFYASNFSISVNILFAMNRILANYMKQHHQYKVSIEEIHHTQKLDYPSGTALTLANDILKNSSIKKSWAAFLEEKNDLSGSNEDESVLPILSKRIGGVPGTHFVKWSSSIDQLEINHVAHSREGFAMGALTAAEWILGKKGIFGMSDLLGI